MAARITVLVLLAAFTLLPGATACGGDRPDERLKEFRFAGNNTFTDTQLRAALRVDSVFLNTLVYKAPVTDDERFSRLGESWLPPPRH